MISQEKKHSHRLKSGIMPQSRNINEICAVKISFYERRKNVLCDSNMTESQLWKLLVVSKTLLDELEDQQALSTTPQQTLSPISRNVNFIIPEKTAYFLVNKLTGTIFPDIFDNS